MQGGNCASYFCADAPYPSQQCHAGDSCQRWNEGYFQCVPYPVQDASLRIWDQCGGRGGDCGKYQSCADAPYPGLSCPASASCQRLNEWYQQCRPAGSSFGSCQQVGH